MINKKGFTLIEILIAIAIMGIVSSLGYVVINKSNRLVNENQVTYNGQQSIKLINKYLTRDLEHALGISYNGDSSNNVGEYSIMVKTQDNKNPRYIVKVYDKSVYRQYDITRQTGSEKVEIISGQYINKKDDEDIVPLDIYKNNNTYEVRLSYDNNVDKYHEFKVTSRYSEFLVSEEDDNTQTPTYPEIDDDMEGENGFIRFEYEGNQVAASIGSSKKVNGAYKTYTSSKLNSNSDIFTTSTSISPNNNNGKCNASIGASNKEKASCNTMQKDEFGKMKVNQINLTLSGDVKFILKINIKGADGTGHWTTVVNETLVGPSKYKFAVPIGKNIDISGTMLKTNNKSKGSVIIAFGTKK